jgi:hypothetical protein
MTSLDSAAFGLANPGQQCSGHGTCLNITLQNEVDPRYLCACDSGWNGVADMFDLRIATVNGTVLTLDCANSIIVHSIIWGIALAATLFRQMTIFAAFSLLIYEGVHKKQKKLRQIFVDGHFLPIITFDLTLANPLLLVTCVRKVFYQEVFGTETLVTVSTIIGITFTAVGFSTFEHLTFRTLTKGALMDSSERQKLDSMHFKLTVTTLVAYSIVGVPSLAALALDKSKGPIVSSEYVLLLLRNIGFLVFYALLAATARGIHRQAARILDSVSPKERSSREPSNNGSTTTSPKQIAAIQVVEFLEQNDKELATRCILLLVIWSIASIPHFWPFHGYFMAILAAIATFKTNTSQILLKSRYRQRSKQRQTVTTVAHESSISRKQNIDSIQRSQLQNLQVQPQESSMYSVS